MHLQLCLMERWFANQTFNRLWGLECWSHVRGSMPHHRGTGLMDVVAGGDRREPLLRGPARLWRYSSTLHFWNDLHKINKMQLFDGCPMPRVVLLTERVDLTKGYIQVPLAPRAWVKTTQYPMWVPAVHSPPICAAWGPGNLPEPDGWGPETPPGICRSLSRWCGGAFGELGGAQPRRLQMVLYELWAAGLTATWGYRKLATWGTLWESASCSPRRRRLPKERMFPDAPKRAKNPVHVFSGLAEYCQQFIHSLSCVAVPLPDLTKKGWPKKMAWTGEMEAAFQAPKMPLTLELVLRVPAFNWPFIVWANVSKTSAQSWWGNIIRNTL